jgi:type III secretion protein U
MSDDKTEPPTDKKIQDARKRGELPKSNDVTSAFVFTAVVSYLMITLSGYYPEHFRRLQYISFQVMFSPNFWEHMKEYWPRLMIEYIMLGMPPLVVAMFAAIAGGYAQVGSLLTLEPLIPKLERLNPADGFKRLFSLDNVIELIKMIVKTAILGAVLYTVIKNSIGLAVKAAYFDLNNIQLIGGLILKKIFLSAMLVFMIIAPADYGYQKFSFMKKQRMSKDEIKREYKEQEGDPQIKAERKQIHMEMINSGLREKVKKANVIIANPTHVAVALMYDEKDTGLPVVVAKGTDEMALAIKQIAEEENIPIYTNVDLARQLYEVKVDTYITPDMFEPVAQVLLWVEQLNAEEKAKKENQ